MTDYRALCSAFVRLVERCPVTTDTDWIAERNELIVCARAALAKGAGVGPTDEGLLFLIGKVLGYDFGPGLQKGPQEVFGTTEELVELCRAVLARYGTHPRPIPVAEGAGVGVTDEELLAAWTEALNTPRTGQMAEYRTWLAHALVLVWAVGRTTHPRPIPVAEPEWYDIASKGLPESGVNVLAAYVNCAGKWQVVKALWVAKNSEIASTEDENSEYDEEKDDYFIPEGWYECVNNWDEYASFKITEGAVTHWRLLPNAPTALPLPEVGP